MHLAVGIFKADARRADGIFLCVDEGVDGAVKQVVREQSEHEGTTDGLVTLAQMDHGSAQGVEGLVHLLLVHAISEPVTVCCCLGKCSETEEKGVGALVA